MQGQSLKSEFAEQMDECGNAIRSHLGLIVNGKTIMMERIRKREAHFYKQCCLLSDIVDKLQLGKSLKNKTEEDMRK